jgi:hypothetical protein
MAPLRRVRSVFEVSYGPLDNIHVKTPSLVLITDEETMLADDVHDPRDAAGICGNAPHRTLREEVEIAGAGNLQTPSDVPEDLLRRQGRDDSAQGYSLLELAELRARELRLEFELADEHDLEVLLRRALEVRE